MDRHPVLDIFHPIVREWFEDNIGQPSPPQQEGWPAVQRGENVLISAPTGAGKTLSAFMECINRLFCEGMEGRLQDGVQVLYISPLKALNNDIYRNLEVPLEGIQALCEAKGVPFPEITKAVRTGDTPSRERQKMVRNPPHILITTPESLFLILTSPKAREMLRTVKYVIIDEIHALLGSKRGVHLALSLERLAFLLGREFVRIGLSATVKPIDEAARYLGGFQKTQQGWAPRPVTIIQPFVERKVDLQVTAPVEDFRVLEDGTIWPGIYREVLELVKSHRSTLVFVNNRSVAEKVAANLNELAGEVVAKTHHGCISREARLEVEKQLKQGDLPCLAATSSLELGIDIGQIDLMIQVASPKSVSRGLQRLGRAGHRLNAVSKGRIIPRTRGDLLESVVISREMLKGGIETERVPKNSLDVLAQQLVSMACVREWSLEEIQEVVAGAYPYHNLDKGELDRVLAMLAGDYEHQEDLPRSPRILWDRIHGVMSGNGYSRMLAVSGSTIPDKGYYPVYLEDRATRLGELDETFVYEARLKDRFMLGTSAWRIVKIEKDRVIVAPSSSGGAKTPFWVGEGLGRPFELGLRFGQFLRELAEKVGTPEYTPWILEYAPLREREARNLETYMQDQIKAVGAVAHDRRIVVEYFSDEVGERRIVVHSPFGGRVNGGLSILLEHALSKALHCQIESSHNDDGVLIHVLGHQDHPRGILGLLSSSQVEEILIDKLPTTPLFSMTFRYNAARALVMGVRKYGKRNPLWVQRMRGLEALQLAEKFADHPLVVETFRECMETLLDVPSLVKVLQWLEKGRIQVVERVTEQPSPFTSDLLFSFMGVVMYEGQLPKPGKGQNPILSDKSALNLDYTLTDGERLLDGEAVLQIMDQGNPLRQERRLQSPSELHGLLLTYGDLRLSQQTLYELGEICPEPPQRWLQDLLDQGRVIQIGDWQEGELWVAAEEQPLYAAALGMESNASGTAGGKVFTQHEAVTRILRRFARFYSPFREEDIAHRYPFTREMVIESLEKLQQEGTLVRGSFRGEGREEWYHKVVLDRMRRESLKQARNETKASDTHVFASFLPRWQGIGSPVISRTEGLFDVILKLRGLYLPAEWWEDFVFPTRVAGYRKSDLDKLCSAGRVVWRVKPGGSTPQLAWFTLEDLTDSFQDASSEDMTEIEHRIYQVLLKRGASFIHVLSAGTGLTNQQLLEGLEGLVWRGLVVNDSFESLRYFLSGAAAHAKARAKRRAAAYRMEMGRWEAAIPVRQKDIQEQLDVWLERYGLVTKEMLQYEETDFSWSEIYEVLKQREYVGKVERGYYIEGLTGMQFMLPKAAQALKEGVEGYLVLNACDPAQVYGRLCPRVEAEAPWLCIPSTAVVSKEGCPVLVLERYGERMAVLKGREEEAPGALEAFVQAFHKGQIWVGRKKITVKQWNEELPAQCPTADLMSRLGFEREMQDMTLWRKV